MKQFLPRYKYTILASLAGGLIGFSYWYFFGCVNGCAITGSPLNSTLYFAFMGGMIPGMLKKESPKSPSA